MKTKKSFYTILTFVIFLFSSFIIASCTKEGPQGIPGLNGENGVDGAQTCGTCHNLSEFLKAKTEQYSHSTHASGANVDRATETCARCHTSMGFRNFIADSTQIAVENPTPINCRTCHPIHETYSIDDFELRTTDSVTLMVGNVIYNYGKSNLCVNCHMARPVDPYPDLSGSEITITSSRYGPHHATQANMFMAVGPIKIPGSMPYLNSAHTRMVLNGCITCHMSPATGVLGGGHQMGVKYINGQGAEAYQYTGCFTADCHGTVSEINGLINPNRAEIVELEEQLKDLLIENGLLNSSGLVPTPLTVSSLKAAAILNYKFVEGDGSSGAHNYRFTKALLTNTIESLK